MYRRRQKVDDLLRSEFKDLNSKAKDLLLKYPEVVHLEGQPFVGVKTLAHHIHYTGPVFFNHQYKSPEKLRSDIKAEIDRLLRLDLIETGESPFANAYLPVAKIDRETGKLKLRLILDLRKLNLNCETDRLPVQELTYIK